MISRSPRHGPSDNIPGTPASTSSPASRSLYLGEVPPQYRRDPLPGDRPRQHVLAGPETCRCRRRRRRGRLVRPRPIRPDRDGCRRGHRPVACGAMRLHLESREFGSRPLSPAPSSHPLKEPVMMRRISAPVVVVILLLASRVALAAENPAACHLCPGLSGRAAGRFSGRMGHAPGRRADVRRSSEQAVAEMEWKMRPACRRRSRGQSVTFVWTGATGSGPSGGSFTIFVNGHAAADCDAVLESTQFPALSNSASCCTTSSSPAAGRSPPGTSS